VTGSLAGAGAALSAAPTVRATVTGSLSSPAAALAAQASCRAFLTGALTAASAINAKVLELVHTSAPTALVATTRTRALHSQAGAAPAVVVSTPTPSIHAMNQTVQLFVRRPAQDADLTSP
jgi:hypothetical protein